MLGCPYGDSVEGNEALVVLNTAEIVVCDVIHGELANVHEAETRVRRE